MGPVAFQLWTSPSMYRTTGHRYDRRYESILPATLPEP